MKRILSFFIAFVVMLAVGMLPAEAEGMQNGENEFGDTINRDDPDFVTASLVIASPGDVLYSCVGHAMLRMQCPKFNLDNCYTYESEDVEQKVLSFLAGNLKMGMFRLPFADYLKQYTKDGRGVKQYRLNLPPKVKQELWRVLDEEADKGACQPFDYLERGCAQSILGFIETARNGDGIEFGPWPEKYEQTRREFVASNVDDFPWNRWMLYTIVGSKADEECSNEQKIVIPTDLVEVLQNASIDGRKIITDKPQVLAPVTQKTEAGWLTPMVIAAILLVLAIVSWMVKVPYVDWLLLAVETLIGLLVTYLVVFSNLPCTEWNWLIIPFNPLLLILWKWRRKWAVGYAIVLAVWSIVMWVYPHQLTDWSYTVLVLALIVMYLKVGKIRLRFSRK